MVRGTVECGPNSPLLTFHQPVHKYPLCTVQPKKVPGIIYQQCAQDTETLCTKMHLAVEIYYILSSPPVGPGKLHWVGAVLNTPDSTCETGNAGSREITSPIRHWGGAFPSSDNPHFHQWLLDLLGQPTFQPQLSQCRSDNY